MVVVAAGTRRSEARDHLPPTLRVIERRVVADIPGIDKIMSALLTRLEPRRRGTVGCVMCVGMRAAVCTYTHVRVPAARTYRHPQGVEEEVSIPGDPKTPCLYVAPARCIMMGI